MEGQTALAERMRKEEGKKKLIKGVGVSGKSWQSSEEETYINVHMLPTRGRK